MEQLKKFSLKKILTLALLSVSSVLCFVFGTLNITNAKANFTSANGSYKLVAHYEFNDASNLGKDSSGYGFNLTNSGATYDSQMSAVSFTNQGYLYAPALNTQNQDFSDLIQGSYSLSFRIYISANAGGRHYIMSTNGWNGGGGLLWNWGGIKGAFSGEDSKSYSGDGTFSSSPAWYRVHVIYNATANTWTVNSTRENDSSYRHSITRQNVPSHTFGGDENYAFSLGAQCRYVGDWSDSYLHADGYTDPLISDFRIYSGVIDQREMKNISNKDSGKLVMNQQVFADHMILQRNKPVEIYGKATPNKTITVTFNGQTKNGTVGSNGEFSVYLDAMTANAIGQTLTVSCDGVSRTYEDVLVGEVFLGIGQSNMAYPMYEFTFGEWGIRDGGWTTLEGISTTQDNIKYNANSTIQQQLLAYKNNAQFLRFYMQGTRTGETRIDWNTWICPTTADFENINSETNKLKTISFTAVCYATQLQAKLDCPVGVVVNAMGGSRVRQWLSPQAAQTGMPGVSDSAIGTLYQSMTKPMGRYTYAGMLWYQGESDIYDVSANANWVNACLALFNEYRSQQNDMSLPVIVYQLPQFYGHDPSSYWQVMREFQAQLASNDDNIYVVCGIDTGDYSNIHPTDKMQLNERAVALALQYIYGKTYSEVYGGANGTWGKAPEIVSAVRKDGYVTLTFKNAVHLSIKQNPDNNCKNDDGNNVPLYLTKNPITFDNSSHLSSSESVSDSFGSYWVAYDNKIGFACSDTSIKYVSYAINNTYADNDRFIYNTYYTVGDTADAVGGVPVMPFTNIEIVDYAEYFSTLTVNDSSMGIVTGYQTGVYENGSALSITITANTGYKISSVKWNGIEETVTNQTTINLSKTVTGATTLEVTFTPIAFQATVTNDDTKGTLTGITNGTTYEQNTSLNISISAKDGYKISSITLNDSAVSVTNDKTMNISHTVTSAVTLAVTYQQEDENIISSFQATVTNDDTKGTITGIANGTSYQNGSILTIKISAKEGYKIKSITLNGSNVSVTSVKEMNVAHRVKGDISLQVEYDEDIKTFTVTVQNNNKQGSVTGVGSTYKNGETVNVTIIAKKGYQIKTIKFGNENITVTNGTKTTFSKTITKDVKIVVTYEKETEESSGGCGSKIGGMSTIILSLLATVSAGALIYKKKEN